MQKLIKTYQKGWLGNTQRQKEEVKLFAQGYKVESEEDCKEWDGGQACCLAIVFLPLALLAKKPMIKVTYVRE
jgi:hypothetical protein